MAGHTRKKPKQSPKKKKKEGKVVLALPKQFLQVGVKAKKKK